MRTRLFSHQEKAFTLVEVLVVIIAIGLLTFIVLPIFTVRNHGGRGHIVCISNLKQVGLAMRMFSNDHEAKFPWEVSTARGGSVEYSNSAEVFRHFVATTNELGSPRVLICPYDLKRGKSADWKNFGNNNLSYFAGLDADESRPASVLSGDRTLSAEGTNLLGSVTINRNTDLRVSGSFHNGRISIGLADGSAQQMTEKQFRQMIFYTNEVAGRLAVP